MQRSTSIIRLARTGTARRVAVALGLLVGTALAGCGSAPTASNASTPNPTTAAAPNTITLSEWAVLVPSTSIKPGTYTYTITNTGATPHELLVFQSSLSASSYPMKAGNIDEEGAGISKISDGDNLAPGASQQRTVDLTHPGIYLFTCNLPSHFMQGMETMVTVA
jgi:uncharacterized cupredoxin-like copper-binding protein